MSDSYPYDIAISFAGEDRSIAHEIADRLRTSGISVFYDEYEKDNLWGKDLYEHLAEVYTEKAHYCLMLISEHYATKSWTNHERENAQARAFRQNEEYILPLRLDKTKIPGLRETIGYINFSEHSTEQIVQLILKKLRRTQSKGEISSPKSDSSGWEDLDSIPMPSMKKTFTEKEKDDFLHDAFTFIKQYFAKGLTQLEKGYEDIETDLIDIHNRRFAVRVYVSGKKKIQCAIWIGGHGNTEQILFRAGQNFDLQSDNSINEYITVNEFENRLVLSFSNMGFSNFNKDTSNLNFEECAESLWSRFIRSLEY